MAKRGTYFHFFGGFRWVVERSGVFQQLHRVGGGEGGWISSAGFQRGWVGFQSLSSVRVGSNGQKGEAIVRGKKSWIGRFGGNNLVHPVCWSDHQFNRSNSDLIIFRFNWSDRIETVTDRSNPVLKLCI